MIVSTWCEDPIRIAMQTDSAGPDAGEVRFLAGRDILITRPVEQARGLAMAITRGGGEPVLFPTIDVAPLADTAALDAMLERLGDFDLVIFVSANAVSQTDVRAHATGVRLDRILCAAAPGPATAAELVTRGVARVIVPPRRFDSEGLVDAIERHGGKFRRALVIRGSDAGADEGAGAGREYLSSWLRGRGVEVNSVAAYRRVRAEVDPARLSAMLRRPSPSAAIVTSSEGGEHLVALLGAAGRIWLAQTPVFVPHPRIASRMRALGIGEVHVTAGGDEGIMRGLADHFGGARG